LKRSTGVLLFAMGLVAGAPSCSGSSESVRDPSADSNDPCYDADITVKRVWNEEVKVKVRAQVMQWGGDVGMDVAEEQALAITGSMDRLSDDWARMRKAVCNDHFRRRTLTQQEYQRRVDCLDRLLTRQRTFLSSLASPRADVGQQLAAIDEEVKTCR
jgi:hypothetical protein